MAACITSFGRTTTFDDAFRHHRSIQLITKACILPAAAQNNSLLINVIDAGLLLWRNRGSTALQLVAPVLCVVLVSAVGWVVNTKQFDSLGADIFLPKPELVGSIPECREDVFLVQSDCVAFVYAPEGHPVVEVSDCFQSPAG